MVRIYFQGYQEISQNLSNNLNTPRVENAETETRDDTTDDEWREITEQPSGVMDTLLEEPDITQDDGDRILSFAPEKETDHLVYLWTIILNIFLSLSFFVANVKLTTVKDKYPFITVQCVKWELRSKDRRVAQSVPNIF